tara:strand:+ start:769 stop:975 length:207 start_codon:yes stop_codon:yes gene_type:complete
MSNLTNAVISILMEEAEIMVLDGGKVSHKALSKKANNLITLGVSKAAIKKALFTVENALNVTVDSIRV